MSTIPRSMRNVLRNPLRLLLVVFLLGASLMFVAAMVSLSSSAQQQLAIVHKSIGTAITINYASNDSQNVAQNGQNNGSGQGRPGGGGSFFQRTVTPIPNTEIAKVKNLSGVSSVEESLSRSDTTSTLKTSSIQTPDGRSITIPPSVNGISTDATHFTLTGGTTPTLVSGRLFQSSDANAKVAMMSQTLATTNNLQVGSTFQLKNTTFTLIGLYTTDANRFADNSLVLPIAVMQSLFSVQGVDSVTVYAQNFEQVQTLATHLRSTLGSSYDVVTQASFYTDTISALNVAQSSIQLALIISIITATLVIIFAVFIMVRERTTEIGTLKAIGASHWQVIRQFWGEVLTLSVAGAILAVILLAALGPVISQVFNVAATATTATATPTATTTGRFGGFGGGQGGFGGNRGLFASQAAQQISNVHLASATLNPQALLIIFGLGMALAVLTSIIPSWYVAHIKPAEVLRRA